MKIQRGTIVVFDDNTTVTLRPVDEQLIKDCYSAGCRIPVVKFIRAQYGLGLRESLSLCELVTDSALRVTR